jgi:hypothetical protein
MQLKLPAVSHSLCAAMSITPASGTAVARPSMVGQGGLTPAPQPLFAYVGSRTTRERNARGRGISVFRVDPQSGALELVQLFEDLINPSYLAPSPGGEFLYAVHGDEREVSAFGIDRESGKLRLLNRRSTEGGIRFISRSTPAGAIWW